MKDTKMTVEELFQKSRVARSEAKAFQHEMATKTDPEERKALARRMNEKFNEAREWMNKAKQLRDQAESIEREFISIKADLEDD